MCNIIFAAITYPTEVVDDGLGCLLAFADACMFFM